MEQIRRPMTLSVIGWYLSITNCFSLLSVVFIALSATAQQIIMKSGQSVLYTVIVGTLEALIGMGSGIAILRGKRWGRLLYAIYFPVSLIICCLITGVIAIAPIAVIFYIAIMVLLTRNKANEYFASDEKPVIKIKKTIRKILGGFSFGVGSFVIIMMFCTEFFRLYEIDSSIEINVFLFMVLFVSFIFIIPGIFIWGRKEWKNLIAVSFTTIGSIFVIGSINNFIIQNFSQWGIIRQSNVNLGYFSSTFPFINNVIVLSVGLLFIYLENKQKCKEDL